MTMQLMILTWTAPTATALETHPAPVCLCSSPTKDTKKHTPPHLVQETIINIIIIIIVRHKVHSKNIHLKQGTIHTLKKKENIATFFIKDGYTNVSTGVTGIVQH